VVGIKFMDPKGAAQIVTPCGSCRQLMAEFAQLGGTDLRVLSCNGDLTAIVVSTVSELLPGAFGPQNLGLSHQWPNLRERLRERVRQLTALRQKP
jgi:cytidine deaminase